MGRFLFLPGTETIGGCYYKMTSKSNQFSDMPKLITFTKVNLAILILFFLLFRSNSDGEMVSNIFGGMVLWLIILNGLFLLYLPSPGSFRFYHSLIVAFTVVLLLVSVVFIYPMFFLSLLNRI